MARFSAPVQTGPVNHPAYCTVPRIAGLFPWGKATGAWRWPFSADVKEGVSVLSPPQAFMASSIMKFTFLFACIFTCNACNAVGFMFNGSMSLQCGVTACSCKSTELGVWLGVWELIVTTSALRNVTHAFVNPLMEFGRGSIPTRFSDCKAAGKLVISCITT